MVGVGYGVVGLAVSSKTLSVAVVEQLGGLLAMALYLIAIQHIFATMVLHKPSESWVLRARDWWLDERLRTEKRRLSPWMAKESAEEPKPHKS